MLPISIIVPCFNCSNTIDETIQSILNGNIEKNDEIVLCDDGSGDTTIEKLKYWSKFDERIKIISHSVNLGGGAARNTAVENSKNDLIFCLDSDNILVSGSLKRLRTFQQEMSVSIAAFKEIWYFKHGDELKKITHKWIYGDRYLLSDILCGYVFPGCDGNYMFTKKSWLEAGRYPENLKALDTWGFGLRQFASKQTYAFLENEGYYHRYSYDSYYVREAKNQNEMNLSALSELVRYFDQIIDRDVRYLCSPHGRKNWYSDLAKRPIRTKDRIKGKTGVVLENIGIV